MRVRVLFFGQLKEIAGRSEDTVEMNAGASLQDVFDSVAGQFPRMGSLRTSIVIARNQQFRRPDEMVEEGDEVAFLPPVSGGTPVYTHEASDAGNVNFFGLTRLPIDMRELAARVLRDEDGAIVNFEGVVRNHSGGRATRFLEYEGYDAMAIQVMAQIGHDLASTYSVGRIAMVHRLGRLEIGEISVAVVVSAPHRKPAFEAALEGINRLKRLVPIWKKEHFVDGEVWVEGEWDAALLRDRDSGAVR